MSWWLLGYVVAVLVALASLVRGASAVVQVILAGQVIYWGISYVVRPSFLMLFSPNPPVSDGISDPRIAGGGYEENLTAVLLPVCIGLTAYLVLMVLLRRLYQYKGGRQEGGLSIRHQHTQNSYFLACFSFGWIFRILSAGGVGSGIVATLELVALVGVGGLLTRGLRRDGKTPTALILLVIISETAWTFVSASKTPIIAVVVFLALRFCTDGWTRQRVALVLSAGVVLVGGFSTFQSYKLSNVTGEVVDSFQASGYPTGVRPFLGIVQRFDQFAAVTDAVFAGVGSWLTPAEIITKITLSFVPKLFLSDKTNAGAQWNLEVRTQSLPGAHLSDVSLAEGFIAEGYVLGGALGIVIGAMFVAGLGVALSYFISSKSIYLNAAGLVLMSFPVLFERGMLGGVEMFSKSLQAAAVATIIFIFINTVTRDRFRIVVNSREIPTLSKEI